MKFGGPKELTGAIDLISRYKLLDHHDFYCKSSLPFSLPDSQYLHNIMGDRDIRKGDGMLLAELINQSPCVKDTTSHIQPFALDILQDAFQLHESACVDLSPDEKGVPTFGSKFRSGAIKEKERKHKEKVKQRDTEDKNEKHSNKHPSKDKEKEISKHGCLNHTDQLQKKKRKHEDLTEQKKSKVKKLYLA